MTTRSFLRACAIVIASLAAWTALAATKPGRVEVELVADDPGPRVAGAPVRLGLRMKMDPGWHTYWKNPGDAGLPTKITWTLPPKWSAGDIDWPAPRRIPVGPLASYGYEDEIVLPTMVFPAADWNGKPTRVEAKAEWLVCKESCIPESATVAIELAADRAPNGARTKALFKATRDAQPRRVRDLHESATRADGRLVIRVKPGSAGQFFPDREELVEPGDAPRVTKDGDAVVWSARLGIEGKKLAPGTPIRGVWVGDGAPALIDAPLER